MAKRMTRDEALAVVGTREALERRLGDMVAAKWGEAERKAGLRLQRDKSLALLANTVAHYDIDHIDETLADAAKVLMSDDDRAFLRRGG